MSAPTRRGFLGIFAAATATAAAGASAFTPATPTNWRTKPVDQWTKADFIAEAEFHHAELCKKAKEAFKVGMDWHEESRWRGFNAARKWWETELITLRSG